MNMADIFTNYNLAVAAVKRFTSSVPSSSWSDRLSSEVLEDLQSILEIAYDHLKD